MSWRASPTSNSTRMGAAGASYGGYMIYWIADHTNRFKTLVSHDRRLQSGQHGGHDGGAVVHGLGVRRHAVRNRALYEKWSPFNFVQNWKTPILIVHSQLDYRVTCRKAIRRSPRQAAGRAGQVPVLPR